MTAMQECMCFKSRMSSGSTRSTRNEFSSLSVSYRLSAYCTIDDLSSSMRE